ncbi:DUF1659 domain-containing protein [Schleiferilactobacillus perolens]|jgi:hypothetical protein|uniref:DUF1659 domain-containing protein n=1 Tax=Schleiferilactobacillus perolens DSM 12744 TaxID=1423792 RepID=A0A0R1NAI0_9LACO|nr:DUF1659 domain-containing protein [Schleiferilactobacillus perolens]KRL14570.1 hypothetical protein FD09_GL000222 [Schleiferilactobacillus perolens DSM 12744]MCI2170090.1 DUF1659 domain-containing protein [Schleiferilactobacillus perolens]
MNKVWLSSSIAFTLENESYKDGELTRRFQNIAEDATPEDIQAVGNALKALHAGDVIADTILTTQSHIG